MTARFAQSIEPLQCAAQVDVDQRLILGAFERQLVLRDRFLVATCLEEGVAEVVARVRVARIELDRALESGRRFVELAAIEQYVAEVVVRDPSAVVLLDRIAPERLEILVHVALTPGQRAEEESHRSEREDSRTGPAFVDPQGT